MLRSIGSRRSRPVGSTERTRAWKSRPRLFTSTRSPGSMPRVRIPTGRLRRRPVGRDLGLCLALAGLLGPATLPPLPELGPLAALLALAPFAGGAPPGRAAPRLTPALDRGIRPDAHQRARGVAPAVDRGARQD